MYSESKIIKEKDDNFKEPLKPKKRRNRTSAETIWFKCPS
jgi:hypothetical protein